MADKVKPTMIHHGTGHIFVTASSSRVDKFHWTVVDDGGHANCTCEGWKGHRKCWHVSEALERCGIKDEPSDFQVVL